jgi:soluble lytic murein transglycosylase-like protein
MRRRIVLAACLVTLLWGSVAHADGEFVTPEAVEIEVAGTLLELEAAAAIETIDVPSLIVDAARRWGVDERVLLRIAWCESRFDPGARGAAGLAGVFQFAPITWTWVAERAGYAGASPYDVYANVEAAAYLYKTEGPRHWGCK